MREHLHYLTLVLLHLMDGHVLIIHLLFTQEEHGECLHGISLLVRLLFCFFFLGRVWSDRGLSLAHRSRRLDELTLLSLVHAHFLNTVLRRVNTGRRLSFVHIRFQIIKLKIGNNL